MVVTVLDMIAASLRVVGALAKSETIPSDEANDAKQALNMMLEQWSARSIMVRAATTESFILTPLQSTYTWGIGGNFNSSKPFRVTDAYIRFPISNIDQPVIVVSENEWNSYEDKSITNATPYSLYYDPGQAQQATQTGTVYLYPAPNIQYTLFINSLKALSDVTNLSDNLTFEGQYYSAIKWNLAIELWPEYHQEGELIPPSIKENARESMRVIETLNSTTPRVPLEIPGGKRVSYNIYTDGF